MSEWDRDPFVFNGTRPYTCVDCGRGMRTRGVDGRCIECTHVPEVRCRGYESASGARILCNRIVQDGEDSIEWGQCQTCAGLQAAAWKKREVQEGRRLLRNRERGYGGPAEGEDVFRGMRGNE